MSKRIWIPLVLLLTFAFHITAVSAEESKDDTLAASSKSAILVEQSTGQILFEKNSHERLPLASVTKVMTMLLAIEAVDSGKVTMEDMVTVSEYASSMTGSRVFLSTNERISVSDLIKSIAVASGNDAAVAMAEFLAGSESNFVKMMNERAVQLGMKDTNFVNCNGLDVDGHYSSAYDISLMSAELLRHSSIREFLTIWMDSLRDGKFTLANTNKLIRFYEGATGVKTGSTDAALFCMSASAQREGMELIAVVMGAPTSKERFADASGLLNYGFSNYAVEEGIKEGEVVGNIDVSKGTTEYVDIIASKGFSPVVTKDKKGKVTRQVRLEEGLSAPVDAGQKAGEIVFELEGNEIGRLDAITSAHVAKAGYFKIYFNLFKEWITM